MTKGYGITAEDINWSCPADLEPYSKAHDLELKNMDAYIYSVCGMYVMSAVSVSVEHCLAGKKAKSKYIDTTITKEVEKNKPLTEDEIQKMRDAFVLKMEMMKANFDANHKDKE